MSFPKYPRYKASGVEWLGEVPEHWEVLPLQRCVEVAEGQVDPKSSAFSEMPLIAPNHIEAATGRLLELESATEQEAISGKYLCKAGDVVYSKIRPALRKVCIAPADALCSADMYPLRAHSGVLNQYLYWYLLSEQFSALAVLESQRVAMPKINRESLKAVVIPRPPHVEQEGIVDFLADEAAKIDALIFEQQRLIELLKEKRQAVISHAVTRGLDPDAPMKPSGVEWLGDVPAHWEVLPLKRLWNVTDCKHVTAEFVEYGYPLASIREVQGQYVNLDCAKRTTPHFYELLIEGGRKPRAGDLIFSRNATVGEVAQVTASHPPFAMGQDVCLLRPSALSSSSNFMQAVLKSDLVAAQLACLMIGSTFKRVNVEEIRNLMIPFPPDNEQQVIATYVKDEAARFDDLVTDAVRAITLLQERRTALISAAVTGKIDVRGLTVNQTFN